MRSHMLQNPHIAYFPHWIEVLYCALHIYFSWFLTIFWQMITQLSCVIASLCFILHALTFDVVFCNVLFAMCRNCWRKSEDDAWHDLDDHSSIRHPRHLCRRFVSVSYCLLSHCAKHFFLLSILKRTLNHFHTKQTSAQLFLQFRSYSLQFAEVRIFNSNRHAYKWCINRDDDDDASKDEPLNILNTLCTAHK